MIAARRAEINKFQFLLGRLETASLAPIGSYSFRFQFLLGRLETPGSCCES